MSVWFMDGNDDGVRVGVGFNSCPDGPGVDKSDADGLTVGSLWHCGKVG